MGKGRGWRIKIDCLPLTKEAIYADAWAELQSGKVRPGLWAKAFAESEGDDSKSRALYIALRVQAEMDRRRQEQEAANALAAESARERAEALFAVVEQLRLKGYKTKRAGDGWTVREPLCWPVKLGSDQALLEYAEGRISPPISKTKVRAPTSTARDEGLPTNRQSDQGAPKKEGGASFSESVPGYSDKTATSSVNGGKTGPSGVGGWLLLLVAGLLVLGPLLGAGLINAGIMTAEHQYPALKSTPEWSNFRVATWWTFIAIIAVSIYGGWGLARGRDWSVVKRAKVVLWLAGPLGALIMDVIVPLATLGESNAGHAQFVGGLLSSIIAAGIWTAYLSKSKRVRNTYGPPK